MEPRDPSQTTEVGGAAPSLKLRTARTLKWNSIDRISAQVLYAITGVVLANVLSKEDFGLAGAIMVFQAFAILFVDSGFGAALLQKKEPTQADYSTVFWFNLVVSVVIYAILWFAAPLIAAIFQHDMRLVPMSRVMFLAFIFSGLGIVQTNRLMKQMNVKQVAVSNIAALTVSGTLGIVLALKGFGAWALVWQSVVLAAVKSGWLWVVCRWVPTSIFSIESLKSIYKVGLGVFASSFLNTLFLNLYTFVVGAFYSLASLGVYTQADKWSKMGSASLSQIFTASFVPLLARFQDCRADFNRYVGKINRFSAFLVFPFMGFLVVAGAPIFHILFGNKWDAAIPLFQILAARGSLVVLVSLYGNYLLSLGRTSDLVAIEIVKDLLTIGAIFATVWFGTIEALVWGQLGATAITWMVVLALTSRRLGLGVGRILIDHAPYFLLTLAAMVGAWIVSGFLSGAWSQLAVQIAVGGAVYVGVLWAAGATTLREARGYILGRFLSRKAQ